MPSGLYQPWHVTGGVWKYRGTGTTPPVTPPVTPPTGTQKFTPVRFTPKTTKPIGRYRAQLTGLPQNVGCPYNAADLTRRNGNLTVTTGQVIEGFDIYGNIFFTGTATVKNCIIRGTVAGLGTPAGSVPGTTANRLVEPLRASAGVISGSSLNLQGSLISFCDIDALGYESAWQDGVRGGNYMTEYCGIHGVVDGFGAAIVGDGHGYANDLNYGFYTAYLDTATGNPRAGFPSQSDRTTHSDGAQMQQASGWQYIGNNIGGPRASVAGQTQANRDPGIATQLAVIKAIDGTVGTAEGSDYSNSEFILNTVGAGNPMSALIDGNWIQGGAAGINISAKATDTMPNTQVINNRFILPTTGFQLYVSDKYAGTLSGNVIDSTGAPATINTFVG